MSRPAPILIALPSGLIVSGVATWAARLVSAMAASGRAAGLILHGPPAGHARLEIDLHPDVRVYDLSHLGRLEDIDPPASAGGGAADGGRRSGSTGATGETGDTARLLPQTAQPSAHGDARPESREAWIGAYLHAVRDLWMRSGEGGDRPPVVLSPNLHADCYAVCLEVARRAPALVRLVGWQHNDIEYDRRVLAHYGPALAAIAGVSDHIVSRLRTVLAEREVMPIAYGVEVPGAPTRREPLMTDGRARPVRLLYAGRLDHHQKRILALPAMSAALADMGIDHELTILGDGPAGAELDRAIDARSLPGWQADSPQRRRERGGRQEAGSGAERGEDSLRTLRLCGESCSVKCRATIHRPGPATPVQVRAALLSHDAFVLASRFEGLSVSMLEALAAGCVPIVARVESGALQAIEPGETGLIADAGPDADERAVGVALAAGVARFLASDTDRMARRAWASARDRFSLELHARHAAGFIDAAAAGPPVSWPEGRGVWFSELGGSVPADAPRRLATALGALAGRRVVVHATGLHTRTLLDQLLAGPATIVGFTDDDRARHGERLGGRPIVAPESAASLGATDVVISTSMHEGAVWARRGVYESQGLRVHRLYE